MRRGEVWWARLPEPKGVRPVLILSRQKAVELRSMITVAPLTRTIRGIAAEVPLEPSDGVPKPCAVNLDSLETIGKALLLNRVCVLNSDKMATVAEAVKFALALE